jgi:hypothetical protein
VIVQVECRVYTLADQRPTSCKHCKIDFNVIIPQDRGDNIRRGKQAVFLVAEKGGDYLHLRPTSADCLL